MSNAHVCAHLGCVTEFWDKILHFELNGERSIRLNIHLICLFLVNTFSKIRFQLLVSTIDFRYITDAITPAEVLTILRASESCRMDRIEDLLKDGYPCYTTQIGI